MTASLSSAHPTAALIGLTRLPTSSGIALDRQTICVLGELLAESLSAEARGRLLSAFRSWRRQ